MTERERLRELLLKCDPIKERDLDDDWGDGEIDDIVDSLLANGVIVPPCKVGDTLYSINKIALGGHWEDNRYIVDKWDAWKVCEIPFSLTLWECGWNGIFLTREEAEKALAERSET